MKIKSGPVIHEIRLLKLFISGQILEGLDNFQLMLDAQITIINQFTKALFILHKI